MAVASIQEDLRSKGRIGTGTIFNDNGLLPDLAQGVGENARGYIGRYARTEGGDDTDGPFRPTIGL